MRLEYLLGRKRTLAYGNVQRVIDIDNILKLVQILTKLYVWSLYFGFGFQIFLVFILVLIFLKFFFILVLIIFILIKKCLHD